MLSARARAGVKRGRRPEIEPRPLAPVHGGISLAAPTSRAETFSVEVPEFEGFYDLYAASIRVPLAELQLPEGLTDPVLRVRAAASHSLFVSVQDGDSSFVTSEASLVSWVWAHGSTILGAADGLLEEGVAETVIEYRPLSALCVDWECLGADDAEIGLRRNPEFLPDYSPLLMGEVHVLSVTLEGTVDGVSAAEDSWGAVKSLYSF